jgi:membrane dipeptidase
MSSLHQEGIVIDGLIISKWDRSVFEDMKKGGLTAANCTVSVWEGFKDTVANIAEMKRLIRDNADLLTLVRSTADIEAAKREGKTGIILGFQNAHAFEDHLGTIEAFADMGVRVVQLCYNTQNLLGTGCYERDGGLSGYGHEVIAEMNRVGIMVDLSHVGPKTSEEAILASRKPVCYSHCLPAGLKDHPRNKSGEPGHENETHRELGGGGPRNGGTGRTGARRRLAERQSVHGITRRLGIQQHATRRPALCRMTDRTFHGPVRPLQ